MVFALALSLIFVLVPQRPIASGEWLVFAILLFLATVTQFMEAHFGRQTYSPHLAPFFAGVLLLPPILFVLLIFLPHLAEWAHKRLTKSAYLPVWYIQPFNIATHIIAGLGVYALLPTFKSFAPVAGIPADFLAGLAGITLYLVVNHYLIGQVLVLARGIAWSDSKMWNWEVLTPDVAMLAVGYVCAVLWEYSPWLVIPALAPLGLMFQSMKVPQLQQEARTDEKTGLVSTRHFKERFEAELLLAKRFNRPLAIVMADLDLLRNINNTHGHLAGDVVIAGIADIIREETRDYDIAGRFGGEEYAIVLPNTTNEIARAVAERLRRVVEARVFRVHNTGAEIRATISVGLAVMPENAESMDALIHEADVALYQAKYRGRNQVVCAMDVPHSFRLEYGNKEVLNPDSAGQQPEGSHIAAYPEKSMAHHQPMGEERGGAQSAPSPTPTASPVLRQSQSQTAGENAQVSSPAAGEQTGQSNHWLFVPYLVIVILGGVLTTTWSLWSDIYLHLDTFPHFGTLLIFAVLAVLAESLNVTMYTKSSVSASATVTLAALLLAGVPGVVATSSAIVIVHYLRQRPLLYRAAFNWSIHILAGVIPAFIFSLSPYVLDPIHTLFWGLLCVVAAIPYFLVETGLIAGAIGLKGRQNIIAVWQEHFGWLALHYLTMSALSVFVALAYDVFGLWGLIGFLLPVFLIQQSQKMYVERTESSVAELNRMNGELQTANSEVKRASREIHNLNVELMEMLAKIIDARDPDISGHAINVAEYAAAIGEQFHFSPERIENLRWAGMLHDIGKLGVPERILHKPATLTEEEYALVKKHAALGGALLETVRGLNHLAPFVRHHHERWDGQGYPAGLAGEEIPFEARVLAVCDAAEAMAAARPYKQRYSTEQIVEELRHCAGKQFDPAITEAFIRELPARASLDSKRLERAEAQKIGHLLPEMSSLLGGETNLPGALWPSM